MFLSPSWARPSRSFTVQCSAVQCSSAVTIETHLGLALLAQCLALLPLGLLQQCAGARVAHGPVRRASDGGAVGRPARLVRLPGEVLRLGPAVSDHLLLAADPLPVLVNTPLAVPHLRLAAVDVALVARDPLQHDLPLPAQWGAVLTVGEQSSQNLSSWSAWLSAAVAFLSNLSISRNFTQHSLLARSASCRLRAANSRSSRASRHFLSIVVWLLRTDLVQQTQTAAHRIY